MNAARLLPIALSASLVACSGAAGSRALLPGTPAGSQPAAKGTAQATIRIVVPLAGPASSTRHPDYVSPNTKQLVVTLTSNNGTSIPVAQQQPQVIGITSSSPNCTMSAGTLTCTAAIVVPVGTDVFSVLAEGQPNGQTGAILSQDQAVTATIAPTVANVVAMTLGGDVASVTVSTAQVNGDLATQPAPGAALATPVTVTAFDCSGATIVGPGSYVTPISLALHEVPANLNSTTLSETSVKGPSDVVTLAWTGSSATQYVTIAPSESAVPCGSPASNAFVAGTFLPRPVAPFLWLSDSGGFHSGNTGTFLIGYPLAWLHDVGNGNAGEVARPGVEIFGGNAVNIFDVAVDHAGNIYTITNKFGPTPNGQGSSFPLIYKYAAGASGAATPAITVPSSVLVPANSDANDPPGIRGIASDPSGNLYVLRGSYPNSADTMTENGDVLRLSAASSYATATVLYHDANGLTIQGDQDSIAVDASDNVFLENDPQPAQGLQGSVLEVGAASSAAFGLGSNSTGFISAYGLAPDAAGHLFVSTSDTTNRIGRVTPYPYASITSGSGTPGTPAFTTATCCFGQGPNELARDAQGYIYVGNDSGFVSVFAPGTSGTNQSPIGSLQDAFDPTTLTHTMVVPAGVPAPQYELAGIAAQN